jgi:hypothetical protein
LATARKSFYWQQLHGIDGNVPVRLVVANRDDRGLIGTNRIGSQRGETSSVVTLLPLVHVAMRYAIGVFDGYRNVGRAVGRGNPAQTYRR